MKGLIIKVVIILAGIILLGITSFKDDPTLILQIITVSYFGITFIWVTIELALCNKNVSVVDLYSVSRKYKFSYIGVLFILLLIGLYAAAKDYSRILFCISPLIMCFGTVYTSMQLYYSRKYNGQ